TVFSVLLLGCGSGGGRRLSGTVTGAITDVDGRVVPGATVTSEGHSTKSLSNGTYTLGDIREGFPTVVAATTINGHTWSGETTLDVIGDEQNRNVNIVVSD